MAASSNTKFFTTEGKANYKKIIKIRQCSNPPTFLNNTHACNRGKQMNKLMNEPMNESSDDPHAVFSDLI